MGRRLVRTLLGAGLVLGAVLSTSLAPFGPPARPAQAAEHRADAVPLALVWRADSGESGCPAHPEMGEPGCAEAAAQMLVPRFRVVYVGPGGEKLTDKLLAQARLYVQPGGDRSQDGTVRAWREMTSYNKHIAKRIRNFDHHGGRYLGMCMGGYLAGTASDSGTDGFQLLPGDSYQYIGSPGASVNTDADTTARVFWRGHEPRTLDTMFFQDGPYFKLDKSASGVTTLARYQQKDGSKGPSAVLVAPYGKGRVGVSGIHPEAPQSWWSSINPPATRPTSYDPLGRKLLDELVR